MKISATLLLEVVEHAQREAPNECCGIIASRNGVAVKVFPARNAADDPYLRYEFDPKDQYLIQKKIEDSGWELGAIYHSHTHTPPYPSKVDIGLAFYPEALYLIVGLAKRKPEVAAFRIIDGNVSEGELVVLK